MPKDMPQARMCQVCHNSNLVVLFIYLFRFIFLIGCRTELVLSYVHASNSVCAGRSYKGCGEFSSACHLDATSKARHELGKALEEVAKQKARYHSCNSFTRQKCAIRSIVEGKTSS